MRKLGIAVLLLVVGALFVRQGLPKLKGWFGGGDPQATPKTSHATIDLRGDKAPAEDGPVIPNQTLAERTPAP